ncbi:hypothetical protein OHT93_37600 [Streptomyces sp. NBC_00191]|uniref:hypothetical protein n=1 Tax=Streptomyces sp. NBC_00191 TaxID=2975674 RepID=UPI00324C27AB
MTDTGALYGLLGAVGGATVASLAAVYGPLRLHRRQAEQKASEEQGRQSEIETARLLKMRTTGRAWIDALERFVQDLQAHRPVDIDRFDEIMVQVSREATEAGHALAHSGLWLESQDTPPHGIPLVPASGGSRPDDADGSAFTALSQLLGRLREATREVRADVLQRPLQRESPVRSEVLESGASQGCAGTAEFSPSRSDRPDQWRPYTPPVGPGRLCSGFMGRSQLVGADEGNPRQPTPPRLHPG